MRMSFLAERFFQEREGKGISILLEEVPGSLPSDRFRDPLAGFAHRDVACGP